MQDKAGFDQALKDRYGNKAGPPKALKPKRAQENNSLRKSMRDVMRKKKMLERKK
jgi:hypothetical protein